jgi:glycosyltransferase involved in cell wall biosynthesis
MSSYNHEKYISEAIDSVLNQSFKDFELIIIDDCSKDNSQQVIESYRKMDERIRTVFHKENMGIAKTLNDGINEAKGRFIAFINSDDVWIHSKLEKQLAILKNDESLIVWSEGEIINAKSVPIGETWTQIMLASNQKKSGNIFEELVFDNFIFPSSLIFKREYVKNVQFDEQLKYQNDGKFAVGLAKKYQFFFIEEPLAKYRIHGKNAILSDKEGWAQDIVIVSKYFLREYGNEISKRTKAHLFFEIGSSYSFLNKNKLAKFFFFQALKSNMTMWNLMFTLTNGKGNRCYFLMNLIRLRRKLRAACAVIRSKL